REPLGSIKVNEILEDGESIGDGAVIELLEKRIKEFDILHKGYVLEGFPMITSDDLPVSEQLEALKNLAVPPEYLIILQMQDKDLYKRRITQKFDPETGKVYAQQQYTKVVPDEYIFDRHYPEPFTDNPRERGFSVSDQGDVSISDLALTEELSDTENETESRNTRESTPEQDKSNLNELDFPQLPPEVLGRLFYRTEDFNIIVNDDLESFRYNFQDLQQYVQNFNKRKVLEVDAYWSPNVLFRRVWEFCEATGLQPVPVPVQIVKPLTMMYYKKRDSLNAGEGLEDDEDDDDDDDADDENDDDGDAETICPDDDQLQETDWVAALRAVAVRGLVDPRFRWRVSRWINLCPVALKLGRSIPGKPELAVSFMDKVFFMSSKRAAEQFINNPRPYLLPKMPTSPVKFIVIGHPLAGKTTFANELARITEGTVIDVNREMIKRFSDVKRDFIWKKRLRYSLEATHIVNKENAVRWHRQERARRRDMHAWIENHLKQLAEAEIEAALERDREMLHKLRTELRKASEYHTMGDPFTADGMCQGVDATLRFNWKKFVQQAFGGKSNWTHQELLQLAWDLFHERRLYYKKRKRDSVKLTVFNDFTSESDEEYGLVSNAIGSGSNESSGTESFEVEDEADMEYEGEGSLPDDDLEDETDEEEEKKKIKKKRRKGKKKRKCVRLEVKPVSPEDIVEPFLFDTFDVDPDDPEVEESVRMRFPLIPFELVVELFMSIYNK
ncbi:Adenylate kinase 9, partial [Orchesella cincta]